MSSNSGQRRSGRQRTESGRSRVRVKPFVVPLRSLIGSRGLLRGLRPQAGFTLIEVVVALAILGIGILGVVATANFSKRASTDNERTVVALNLAREGIESVRTIRDSNWAIQLAPPAEGGGRAWDCYPQSPSAATSSPFSCNGNFTATGPGTFTQFVLYPNLGNGVPYLVGSNDTQTQRTVYLICTATTGEPVYTPTGAALPCPSGSIPYYRRVQVTRGKQLNPAGGGTSYSAKVQVFVSWPGRRGPDITLEEYLTDWKKT